MKIEEVELDDGIWEVEGYGSDGHEIEMKVEAHSATPVPTEAMNSQPIRVVPEVARARAKWRMPTQVPNRQTAPAQSTSD